MDQQPPQTPPSDESPAPFPLGATDEEIKQAAAGIPALADQISAAKDCQAAPQFDVPPYRPPASAIDPADIDDFFRPKYRQLTPAEIEVTDRLKLQAAELLRTIETQARIMPAADQARLTLAVRQLETTVFWAVKAVTG